MNELLNETDFKFKVENCVGSANLGIQLNLQELYKRLLRLQSMLQEESQSDELLYNEEWPFVVRHQPREFPGLILKLRYKVRASLLIFSSGNIVILKTKELQRKDLGQFQTGVQKLKRVCDERGWGIIGTEEGYIIVAPKFVKIRKH